MSRCVKALQCGLVMTGMVLLIGAGALAGCSKAPTDTTTDDVDASSQTQPQSAVEQQKAQPQAPQQHNETQSSATSQSTLASDHTLPVDVGWDAHFVDGSGGMFDTVVPTGAFALDEGERVYPPVKSNGFLAVYSGVVRIDQAGTYRFGAQAEGGMVSLAIKAASGTTENFDLQADGTDAFSDWFALPEGRVLLTYTFARQGNEPARMRPMWEKQRTGSDEPGFMAEPIPSRVVEPVGSRHNGALVLRGRALLGKLGCVSCHEAPAGSVIARAAPDLATVARRADPDWITRWITEPQTLKPGCGMPDLIGESDEDMAAVQGIVGYLVSLSTADEGVAWSAPATESEVLAKGRSLYESVGCVACHGVIEKQADPNETHNDDALVAPFGDQTGKWNLNALSAFLQDPTRDRPGGRMPSMNLSEEEADLIATYLVSVWGPGDGAYASTMGNPADEVAMVGRQSLIDRNCIACHALPGLGGAQHAKSIRMVHASRGCLDPSDTSTPRYRLAAVDRRAIEAAINELASWEDRAGGGGVSPVDHALLTVESFDCRACHDWHGSGGVAAGVRDFFDTAVDVDLGDEGRLPPRLSGVGWKLTGQWLGQVLDHGAKARPMMKARMPIFGSRHVHALADDLASLDGVWPEQDAPEPTVNDSMVQAGRKLVGTSGLNCVSCHTFGDNEPLGIPGPNIADFGERIRYDWWKRYIEAPGRFKPGTRMPSFFASGTSPVGSVLDGDPAKQADAMWAYFSLGRLFMPEPEGFVAAGSLTLRVGDRPMVFRAFLDGVGARGIAIGYPAGVHVAFDAATFRLVYAWTGSFVDASGAWAGRGGMTLTGQGPRVWEAPPGPAVQVLDNKDTKVSAWDEAPEVDYRGYELDESGSPTMLGLLGQVHIGESFEPYPKDGVLFARRFVFDGLDRGQVIALNLDDRSRVGSVQGGHAVTLKDDAGHEVPAIEAESQQVKLVLEVLP